MSLKVWLPLNGDLKNQGLSSITVTNNGATVDNSGKIGKCYSFNNTYLSIPSPLSSSTTSFSICAWVNISSLANGYGPIYDSRTGGSDAGIVFWLTSSGFRLDDGNMWSPSCSLPTGSWIHVCWTRSPSNQSVYLNGSLVSNTTTVGNLSLINTTAWIGRDQNSGDTYHIKGKLNDVRIYDNCLTPEEVKHISQGLVAHYTLGSACAEAPALRSRLSSATWNLLCKDNLSNGGFTVTKSGNTYTFVCNNFGRYLGINLSDVTPIENHKYYLEINIRQNSLKTLYFNSNPYACITGALIIPTNGVGLYKTVITKTYMSGKQVWELQNVEALTSGSILFDSPKIVDLTVLFGAGNEPTADSFCKAFPGYYPYDSGTTKDLRLTIPDSSGYSRNLTITGNVSSDSNTPRYDKAILFPANETSRLSTSLSIDPNAWTISFWEKCDWTNVETSSPYIVYWGSYIRILKHSTSGRMKALYFYKDSEGTQTNTQPYFMSAIGTDTSWKHFSLTFDGSTLKTYLNGILSASSNLPSGFSLYDIGENFRLNYTAETIPKSLSDFRIYATALSADDVKDLYNLGASIS